MSGRIRYERTGQRGELGFKESYPSPYVGRSRKRHGKVPIGTPASELRPRAINCAQCNLWIEDYGAIATCPFCTSDNFLGRQL